ncbi:MAG TPA: S8 family serine peptidase, partial [Steroidobacteraceae bacterium]|nr:S8 family serine peptidase [Steroidobacteraceae bacterium]
NQLDLCIQATGNDVIGNLTPSGGLGTATCTGPNAVGADPVQVMFLYNPANAAGNTAAEDINIIVGLAGGTAAPGRIKVVVEDDGAGSKITQFATNSGTIQGHPGAAGAAAVGAAFFANTPSCGFEPLLELFSSAGGDPILFDVNGTRLPAPGVMRQKPDFVGPDGGNNTFLGFTLADGGITDSSTVTECFNNASFPNFFGTSAAAPHVASIAALFLQANPTLTPAEIVGFMQSTAVPMEVSTSGPVPNVAAGYGLVQANLAANMVPATLPPAPTLTLASSSIIVGSSTTLTWSSANNQGCTASGSWTGALASSGTQTVTPTAAGTDTYTLLCTNGLGASPPTSVTLTVTGTVATQPPTTSGGGGGTLGLVTLLGLFGVGVANARRSLHSRRRKSSSPVANIA